MAVEGRLGIVNHPALPNPLHTKRIAVVVIVHDELAILIRGWTGMRVPHTGDAVCIARPTVDTIFDAMNELLESG